MKVTAGMANRGHFKKTVIRLAFLSLVFIAAFTNFSCGSFFGGDEPEDSGSEQTDIEDDWVPIGVPELMPIPFTPDGSEPSDFSGAESQAAQPEPEKPRIIPTTKFCGFLFNEGAMPAQVEEILAAVEEELKAEQEGADPETLAAIRAAFPSLPNAGPGTDYFYFAQAHGEDAGDPLNPNPIDIEANVTLDASGHRIFTFALELNRNWTITTGLKKRAVGTEGDPTYQAEKILLTDSFTCTTSAENPIKTHAFVLKPSVTEGGKGTIDLKIILDSANTHGITTITFLNDDNPSETLPFGASVDASHSNQFNIYSANVDSGAYKARIILKDGAGYQKFCSVQTINVFDNMTTDKWEGVPLVTSGTTEDTQKFEVTDTAITQAAKTLYYVGSTTLGAISVVNGVDKGTGSPAAPFASLQKAIDTIAANGNGTKDYTIFVNGEISSATGTTLGTSLNGKASSIRIQGKNSSRDILKKTGLVTGSVLKVETNVPVTIENLTITGGNNTGGNGGGINIIPAAASVTLGSGTVVTGNSAANGRGVCVGGTFIMKGTARVASDNDVFLKDGKVIAVQSLAGSGLVAKITEEHWTRYSTIVTGTGFTDAIKDRFGFYGANEDGWVMVVTSTAITLDSPIFVGSTSTITAVDTNSGTKSSPYASIERACQDMIDNTKDYVIKVNGTVSGNQAIPSTLTNTDSGTYRAKSVTIEGLSGSSGENPDQIHAENTVRALSVNTLVPVTIKNLLITHGNASGTSGYGGGIYVDSNTSVMLDDGVVVNNNVASARGGGIYVKSTAKLFVCGTAVIGDTTPTVATSDTNFVTWGNLCAGSGTLGKGGGGIYNEGAVYLGYERDVNGNPSEKNWTGSVSRNCSLKDGGGIYNAAGSIFKMCSGAISYNNAEGSAKNGGGIYFEESGTGGDFEILGGSVIKNHAEKGGSIYVTDSFKIKGSAYIAKGAGTDADPYNDVYLPTGKSVIVSGTLSPAENSDGKIIAAITPQNYKRGTIIVSGLTGSIPYTLIDADKSKFDLLEYDSDWTKNVSLNQVTITAPVYVVDSLDVGNTRPEGFGLGNTAANGALGTKSKPFSTIADALTVFEGTGEAEIIIAGTVNGAQSISSMNPAQLTLKGYRPEGAAADYVSTAALSGGFTTPTANGSTLSVNLSSKTVIIQDLTIKGGNTTTNGGGINLTGGTLHLRDGAKVTGNKAESGNGGGVYVGTGTTLLMSGTAWVGDGTESRAVNNADGSGFTNKASKGAGIYNDGGIVALGYSLFTIAPSANQQKESLTGGVGRNYATTDGGGIYNASGSLFISTGKISYNTCTTNGGGLYTESSTRAVSITTGTSTVFVQNVAAKGGGLYIAAGKSVNLDGNAVFKCNTATNSGGAIYNEGTLNMSAGTIGGSGLQNTADSAGGAVYNNGTFNFSGVAYIYPGSVTSSTKTNDVYLPSGKYITIDAAYSTSGAQSSTAQMAISPYLYKRGTKILKVASTVTADATLRSRFKLSEDPNNDWNKENKTVTESGVDQTYVIINSAVYVAGSDGRLLCSNAGTTAAAGATGTRSKPFSTIAEALNVFEDSSSPAEITIDGEVTGGQTIGGTGVTINASEIRLNGFTNTVAGVTSASGKFKGGFNASTPGSTLSIDTAIPVTISNMEITGGYSSSNGGGINIINASANVRLADVKIQGNYAAGNGGGLYIPSGAKVSAYGSGFIVGNLDASEPAGSGTALSTGINKAANGGGIYNAGTFVLGGSLQSDGTVAEVALAGNSCKIYANVATGSEDGTGNGGGIYVADTGTLHLNHGNVKHNYGSTSGGAIYNSGSVIMWGDTVLYDSLNKEKTNDIYLAGSTKITLRGDLSSVNGTNPVATITPSAWTRGKEVFEAAPSLASNLIASYSKFKVSDIDWSVGYYVSGTPTADLASRIGADIWVAGTYDGAELSGDVGNNVTGYYPGKAPDNTNRGTKLQPYADIATAVAACWSTSRDFTINIDGTVGGAQIIGGTDVTINAKSLTLQGYKTTGFSAATLKGKRASEDTVLSTLKVEAASVDFVVTVKDLKITGGNATGTMSDRFGGGINIEKGTVELTDGAVVTGNKAKFGGGVRVGDYSYSRLVMNGKALIGDDPKSNTVAEAGNCANYAETNGGGIYAGTYGQIKIGYKFNSSGSLVTTGGEITSNETDGYYGVRRNYAVSGGGGIYTSSENSYIASGNISYNKTAQYGGGISNVGYSKMQILSGSIDHNVANTGGGINSGSDLTLVAVSITDNSAVGSDTSTPYGGGIYNSDGKLNITGATKISRNKAISETKNAYGGGIYNASDDSGEEPKITGEVEFDGNSATTTAAGKEGCGGAIYNYLGTFIMSNGSIGKTTPNTATTSGGAVYQGANFTLSGAATLYNSANAEKNNDVYLASGKTITVASTTLTGGTTVATVTPASWNRGTNIIYWDVSASDDQKSTIKGQIKLSKDNNDWDRADYVNTSVTPNKYYVYITSPIYVAGSSGGAVCDPPPADASQATGTKKKPYATIAAALGASDLAVVGNKITIDGTIGKQEIAPSASLSAVTIAGYKSASDTTSSAKIDAGGTTGAGSALTVNKSGLTVTITDLTITGGNATNGGGINITKGTVKLTDGAVITGNSAAGSSLADETTGNGGGVFVGSNGTLFMYGKALIGDSATATGQASSNEAYRGAGIYTEGNVYIGYDTSSHKTAVYADTSASPAQYYGIRRNKTKNGGLGAGIYHKSGTLEIASGDISYNSSTAYGGGGALYSLAATSIMGGTITSNYAQNGGAIYVKASYVTLNGSELKLTGNQAALTGGAAYNEGTLTINGAEIGGGGTGEQNSAGNCGGAVYNANILNMGGNNVKINAGSEKTNDIYLAENKPLNLTNTLPTGAQIAITPWSFVRGNKLIKTGSAYADELAKFAVTDANNEWRLYKPFVDGTDRWARLDADLWVASTGSSSGRASSVSEPPATASERKGTKSKPYATIDEAVAQVWDDGTSKTVDFTVNISGSLSDAQTIADTVTKAKSIKLLGDANAAKKEIDGGNTERASAMLTINSAVPVTITNLTIKNGNSSGSGGGISVSAAGASLTLSTGAVVSGNTTSGNGGGIYIAGTDAGNANLIMNSTATVSANSAGSHNGGGVYLEYANLCMSGSALIGDTGVTGITKTGGNSSNSAARGGGVYCSTGSNIYLGCNTSGETSSGGVSYELESGYGICHNYGKLTGGGVDLRGSMTIKSGAVSYNATRFDWAGSDGGGIWQASGTTITMSGGTIAKNKANYGGGVYAGGSFTMTGGTIGDSSSTINSPATNSTASQSNSASNGGGIYAPSGASVSISGGYINYNYASASGGGIYWEGSTLSVTDGNISYNYGNYGGGIYFESGATLTKATFTKNNASSGGALNIASGREVTVSGAAAFTGNTAYEGGAVYNDGTFMLTGGATFNSNSAGTYGGAVYNDGAFTMSAGTIGGSSGQNSAGSGGAVWCESDSTFTMSGSAYIPYGGSVNSNDIFLNYGSSIGLGDTLSNHSTSSQVGVTLSSGFSTGNAVLTGTSTNIQNHYQKFNLTADTGKYIDEDGYLWEVPTLSNMTTGAKIAAFESKMTAWEDDYDFYYFDTYDGEEESPVILIKDDLGGYAVVVMSSSSSPQLAITGKYFSSASDTTGRAINWSANMDEVENSEENSEGYGFYFNEGYINYDYMDGGWDLTFEEDHGEWKIKPHHAQSYYIVP